MNTANAPTASTPLAFDPDALANLNAAFGMSPLRTTDGAESIGSTTLRAALAESMRMDPPPVHAPSVADPSHTHAGLPLAVLEDVGQRFGDAASSDRCASLAPGVLLPECMTDQQFEEALAAMSRKWCAAVDAFLAEVLGAQVAA